jgi:hypothetical protein
MLEEWISLIPKKQLINKKIQETLSNKYDKITNLQYIISFDIEFLNYNNVRIISSQPAQSTKSVQCVQSKQNNYERIQTIHELGGLIFERKKDGWYLNYLFHFNLIPLIKNIKQYYLLTSQYNTLCNNTLEKVLELEKQLLPENIIINMENINLLGENTIIKKYLPYFKKFTDIDILKKKISKIKYMIKGHDLSKSDYELFKKIITLILNDKDSIQREIKKENQKKFIKLTNELFSKSYLIVKGVEDIKALKNHTILLNEESVKLTNYFDIAIYNEKLFKKCNSAELEKTFICLEKLNKTQTYNDYYQYIKTFTNLKAHNPLVDAYYTWIIFNIYL